MKKIILLSALIIQSLFISAQTLETVKTYHDPYTRTKIFEVYTVIKNTPTKQGSYKSYDETGALYEDYNMNKGLKHGICKRYYTPMLAANFTTDLKAYLNKLYEVANYSNGQLNGSLIRYQYPDGVQKTIYEAAYSQDTKIKEVQYYNTDQKKSVYQVNGPCYEWSEDGKVLFEGTKKNGLDEGTYRRYTEDGKLLIEGTAKEGKRIGTWKWYYNSGRLKNQTDYSSQSSVLKETEYSEGGKILFESERTSESNMITKKFDTTSNVITQQWNQIGIINSEGVEEFHKEGEEIKYYSNGILEYKAHYKKGSADGEYIGYYTNGKTKIKYTYVNNEIDGEYMEFSDNGTVVLRGDYSKGKKVGMWNSYYFDGEIKEKNITGLDGEYLYLFDNGKPKTTGNYRDGKKFGRWEHFDVNADLSYYEVFEDGRLKEIKYKYEWEFDKRIKRIDSLTYSIDKKYKEVRRIYQAVSTNVLEEAKPKKPVLYKAFNFYYDQINKSIQDLSSRMLYADKRDASSLALEKEAKLDEMNMLLERMIVLHPMKTKKTLEKQLEGVSKLETIKDLIFNYTE